MELDEQDPTPEGELILRVIAHPRFTNALGDIYAGWLLDHVYERKIIINAGEQKISYRNFGLNTRIRALNSITKEPNTIEWINSFESIDML